MANFIICISDKFTFKYVLSLDENTTISCIKKNLAKTLICGPEHICLSSEGINLDDLITLQELKATMPGSSDIINLSTSAILHSEATAARAPISPLEEDLLTPASLLWMEWVRKIKQENILPLNTLGIDNTLLPDGIVIDRSKGFPTTIAINDLERCIKDSLECKTLPIFLELWGKSPLCLSDFERLMELFAIPESHAIFSVALLAAVTKAKKLKENGLINNIAQHVAQALLPLAAKIFADAINSSIMGGARGAFAGFLPRKQVEELLNADGRIGSFLYRFSGSRACEIAISYLAPPNAQTKPGEAPSTAPRVMHEILKLNSSVSGFVLRGIEYSDPAQALAKSNSFLKHPCLIASLAIRVGTIEGAKIVAPKISVPHWVRLNVLMQEGCGELDLTFDTTAMNEIKKVSDSVHPFEPKSYAKDYEGKYKTIFDKSVIATLTPAGFDLKTSLQKYNFQAFHGTIDYQRTVERLYGKPKGSYLLRASQSQKGSFVLAFVDAAGKVQQSIIRPDHSGSGKVVCSEITFSSLQALILAYSTPPASPTGGGVVPSALLRHGIAHYPHDKIVTKPLTWDEQYSHRELSGTTLVPDSLPSEISGDPVIEDNTTSTSLRKRAPATGVTPVDLDPTVIANDTWNLYFIMQRTAEAARATTATSQKVVSIMTLSVAKNFLSSAGHKFSVEITAGLNPSELLAVYKLCHRLFYNDKQIDTNTKHYIENSSLNTLLCIQKYSLSRSDDEKINHDVFKAIEEQIFKIRDEPSYLPTPATASVVSAFTGTISSTGFPVEPTLDQTAQNSVNTVRRHGLFDVNSKAAAPVNLPQAVAAPAPQVPPSLPGLSGLSSLLGPFNLTSIYVPVLRNCLKILSSSLGMLKIATAGMAQGNVNNSLEQNFDFSALTNQIIHSRFTGREDLRLKGDAPYLLEYALKFKSRSLPEDVLTPVEVKLKRVIKRVKNTLLSKDLTNIGLGILPNPREVDIKTCIENRTGVSRHHSLFLAALVGKLVQNNFIPPGKVSHYRAVNNNLRAHSFTLYTEETGTIKTHFIIDSVLNICEKIQNQLDFDRVVTIYKEKGLPWFLRNFAKDHGFSYPAAEDELDIGIGAILFLQAQALLRSDIMNELRRNNFIPEGSSNIKITPENKKKLWETMIHYGCITPEEIRESEQYRIMATNRRTIFEYSGRATLEPFTVVPETEVNTATPETRISLPTALRAKPIVQRKHVRILSIDFDGCLFNHYYCDLSSVKDVIKHNLPFLNEIKATNADYSKVFGIIGSNRQSKFIDDCNYNLRGSCFSKMKEVCDYLSDNAPVKTILDMFLMADLYGYAKEDEKSWEDIAPLQYGTSYKRAMEEQTGQVISHADWWFDSNKITLIYAQMHKMAYENQGESIVFDFYDDKLPILSRLQKFYDNHSNLIPHGLTLRLNQYAGDNVTLKATINGSGMIDINFINTIKKIVKLTLIGMGIDHRCRLINDIKLLDVDLILNRELNINPAALTERVLIPNTLVAENTHATAPVVTTSPTERRAAELSTFFTEVAATPPNSNLQNYTPPSLSRSYV